MRTKLAFLALSAALVLIGIGNLFSMTGEMLLYYRQMAKSVEGESTAAEVPPRNVTELIVNVRRKPDQEQQPSRHGAPKVLGNDILEEPSHEKTATADKVATVDKVKSEPQVDDAEKVDEIAMAKQVDDKTATAESSQEHKKAAMPLDHDTEKDGEQPAAKSKSKDEVDPNVEQVDEIAAAKSDVKHEDEVEALQGDDAPLQRIYLEAHHRVMGLGKDVACNWTTGDTVLPFLHLDAGQPDLIQQRSVSEGICIPNQPELRERLHIFSTEESHRCLLNATLLVGGDSYNRQLFVGLGDILLADPSNDQIRDGDHRMVVLNETRDRLDDERMKAPDTFPEVSWSCYWECYGQMMPFWQTCSRCMKKVLKTVNNPIPVIGTMVHVYNKLKRDVRDTTSELTHLWSNIPGLIYQSQPSYEIERVAGQYKADTKNRTQVYDALLLKVKKYNVTFLDFVELTKTCRWENCTADGGHRSRFVNRWKAQLLLNTICSYK